MRSRATAAAYEDADLAYVVFVMEAATTDDVLIVGFVVGVVKAARAKWSSVDGAPIVTIVAALAGSLAAVALSVSSTGTFDAQTVARGVVTGAAAVGGIAAIDRIKAPTPVPSGTPTL
jgi:hypothetical protein